MYIAEHYGRAMKGMKHTRRFKKYTRIFRVVPQYVVGKGKIVWSKISGGRTIPGRRSLVWTAETQLYRLSNLGFR